MVGLIAAATGLITLYGCLRLALERARLDDDLRAPRLADGLPEHLGGARRPGVLDARRRRSRACARVAGALARARRWPCRRIGFAVLTQSRGAAVTLLLVSPFAIALVRERLRLTAFLLVALAGLLPALPALRTAVDEGTAAAAGTAASRLLLGAVVVAVLAALVAIADQRISLTPERRRAARPRRGRRDRGGRRARDRSRAAEGRAGPHRQRLALVHARRRAERRRARTCSPPSPTAGTSGAWPPTT